MSTDHEIPGEGSGPELPEASANRYASAKPVWHRPTITRIDMKRTLFGAGTINDGSTVSPSGT